MRLFRRHRHKGIKIIALVAGLLVLALLIFLFIDRNINPAIISTSEAHIHSLTQSALNASVKKILGSNIKYTDLVNVLTDKDGKISMIQANTIRMNSLASEVSSEAQNTIRDIAEITVPLGSVTGSKILAGWGPNIPIRILPYGSIRTDFDSEFENSGINQTRHKIFLILDATVRVVIPMGSENINVSIRVPVAESIIVGDVPDSYINVDEMDKALNLVPDAE